MPTKPNHSGQQQEYVPAGNGDASGEYADNATGSNVHFKSFKKPEKESGSKTEKTVKDKPVGVKVEEKEKPTSKGIKENYNGKGKSLLENEMKNRFPRSKNLKTLLDDIKEADDDLSGVIGDFYVNNPNVELKLGKNLKSAYKWYTDYWTGEKVQEVAIGYGAFGDNTQSYAKGSVFFHESGHALDRTYGKGTDIFMQWSVDYKGEDGKSLSDTIYDELKNSDRDALDKEIKAEKDKALEKLRAQADKTRKELNKYDEGIKAKYKTDFDNVQRLREEKNKFVVDNVVALRDRNSQEYAKYTELNNSFTEANNKYWNAIFNEFNNDTERLRLKKEYDNAYENERVGSSELSGNINRKYGDLSDMFQASTGKMLSSIGMGHDENYFNSTKRGSEAFAEILSAKATNPESYKLMKKYIPQTLAKFDEIMEKIKNGKN